jgi:hypothetical protein
MTLSEHKITKKGFVPGFIITFIRHYMEVGGQPHAPAGLLRYASVGLRISLKVAARKRSICPRQESHSGFVTVVD